MRRAPSDPGNLLAASPGVTALLAAETGVATLAAACPVAGAPLMSKETYMDILVQEITVAEKIVRSTAST
jgi:hypothetical protein